MAAGGGAESAVAHPVEIREFGRGEWPVFRELRLRALADAPEAFVRTLDEEQQFTAEQWADRLAQAVDSPTQLSALAEVEGDRVGLVYARMEGPEVANLFSMWVDRRCRRSGVGKALVEHVTDWSRGMSASRVSLQVTERNEGARLFYQRLGFALTCDTMRPYEGTPVWYMEREL